MRILQTSLLTQKVKELFIEANVDIGLSLVDRLRSAMEAEASPIGKNVLAKIIANDEYSTNVMAFEASTVYMIKAEIFISILRHNNAFCYRFLEEIASDLAASDARTVNLTQKHIRGRLAEALLQLHKKYGVEEDGATINMYLSREDLANLSNMTTSNAIRTLANFVNEHVIAMDGRKLKIIDEERLRRISKLG